MALGAYALVRFSNDLNDQRVNLGVVLWHPQDGFRTKFTHQLDRAHAVDPRARVSAIKQQMSALANELASGVPEAGRNMLESLPRFFAHGVEVSDPYPAEISDVEVTLEMLYGRLVSPVEEFRRASSQRQFEKSLKSSLASVVRRSLPAGARFQEVGNKRINGVAVDVGFRVTAPHLKTTWRALSLQSEDRVGDQVAKAKAVALDIKLVRQELADYRQDKHIVAVRPPKTRASESFKDSIAWLKHGADDVVVVPPSEPMETVLEAAFVRLSTQARGR